MSVVKVRTRICTIEGCERKHSARGYCPMHYMRWQKHGDALVSNKAVYRIDEDGRECIDCKAYLPWDQFHTASRLRAGKTNTCKECTALRSRKRWLKSYGLTEEAYEQLLEQQNYACAACKNGFGEAAPHIDHDHSCCIKGSCGECVRGILCKPCNWALGQVKDDVDTLRKIIAYLETQGGEAVCQ